MGEIRRAFTEEMTFELGLEGWKELENKEIKTVPQAEKNETKISLKGEIVIIFYENQDLRALLGK